MTAESAPAPRFDVRPALARVGERLRAVWGTRWGKIGAALIALPILGYIILWLIFAATLPSAESLLTYQPDLPSNVRDVDGNPVQTFARERRVELAYDEYPEQLIQAFISAEDKTFFSHGGIDYPGTIGAVFDYISKAGSGERARGGSTITQQVAKNLLLGDEYSVARKIKEAFLARRIENVLTKQQILELYLNQIFLGRNAYGVQSAARAYFDKDVDQLTLPEVAYLAVLPKAPSNYDPQRHTERALDRRNYVLREMESNGYITAAQRAEASAAPLGTVRGPRTTIRNIGGYFMEEVRRTLIDRYGEKKEKGPNGVYSGGLWVRTSVNVKMQESAATALRDALVRYDRGRGWRDPGLSIDMASDWRSQLAAAEYGVGYDDWRKAVVLEKAGGSATIGFEDGSTGTLPASGAAVPKRGTGGSAFNYLKPGMIIAVKDEGGAYALRSVPEVSGGMVVEEVGSGRILAMQGGFDVRGSSFNRATQAQRQPGSTFKPIVYSAALDNGMTPATLIADAPFCASQGAGMPQKCFRNFSGGYAGQQTMRWGLEQSRNLMTVRAASQTGMDKVVRLSKTLGVGEYDPYLSISLGAGDTTVTKMTNAFAILANQGRALTPTLIDYVQDRNGKVIYRTDTRPCAGCNAPDWDGRPMPRPPLRTKQLMDPMTAYQMVHILEGVVQRGTAQTLRELGRPMFGKTGTTTGPTNVWFIGGTPQVVAGVYMGFDQPRPMGGYAQGGTLAAPIFKQFAKAALMDLPVVPFRAPQGIRMVRIDRRSGQKVYGAWPTDEPKAAVIWEAFKPESEPRRVVRRDTLPPPKMASAASRPARAKAAAPPPQTQSSSDFLQREGGIY
ncbi:PBP1A family penicillin-binding protein [Allosphingosinicella flava]|uniref:Penicillin-binding protein 1A n=1 Tax=Allosphingosinicella flava TaxID=2771430 RepID=A0A7T2GJH0_9SPHN|nr:PBP1A family penicillin-binding protein [Sphingosinicella flava]QPQ55017.1 PBP1A family penicillin-binding protein [Sphingosinicella flava]